jgi:hypothetical protein
MARISRAIADKAAEDARVEAHIADLDAGRTRTAEDLAESFAWGDGDRHVQSVRRKWSFWPGGEAGMRADMARELDHLRADGGPPLTEREVKSHYGEVSPRCVAETRRNRIRASLAT